MILRLIFACITLLGIQVRSQMLEEHDHSHQNISSETSSDEKGIEAFIEALGCILPTSEQTSIVNDGNLKLDLFLNVCAIATNNSSWCVQLTRPNPSSKSTFYCTYGANQPHLLIHPDESTWENAFQAVILLEELATKGIYAEEIYNWWRPEPYNKNVGGAAGRHPYGTSVDVRFINKSHASKAHAQLCKWRKEGRLRALGDYGSSSLHLGIGDATANTWGKQCS